MQNSREVTCIIFSNYSSTGFSAASAFVQHLAFNETAASAFGPP